MTARASYRLALGLFFMLAGSPCVTATTINLTVSKDATLYQVSNASNVTSAGGDEGIFAGRTAESSNFLRRGLIAFDLSPLPANATITSASLKLRVTLSPEGVSASTTMTLQKLLGDWGEGTRNPGGAGGQGAGAANNDATWFHQFRPGDLWTTPGGDFTSGASASATVGLTNSISTWSSAQMAADIQGWLANPATNFGWLVKGVETTTKNARRFASSEHATASFRPVLTVDFSTPPARKPGDLNNDGSVNNIDLLLFTHHLGATVAPNNFDLGDFNNDGSVGVVDLMLLQNNFTPSLALSPTAVPEPTGATLCVLGLAAAVACRRSGRVRHAVRLP